MGDFMEYIDWIAVFVIIAVIFIIFIYDLRHKPIITALIELVKNIISNKEIVVLLILLIVWGIKYYKEDFYEDNASLDMNEDNSIPIFMCLDVNPSKNVDEYDKSNLCDGKPETCWVSGTNSSKAFILFYNENNSEKAVQKVDKIYINNGNCYNETAFCSFSAAKNIEKFFSDGTVITKTFDYGYFENIECEIDTGGIMTNYVKIVITDIYPANWDRLAISDVWFE